MSRPLTFGVFRKEKGQRKSGAMRGERVIAGRGRALRHVLFQAAAPTACHYPVLKPVAQALDIRGKPHKLIIIAIARRLITTASVILKTSVPWPIQLERCHSC